MVDFSKPIKLCEVINVINSNIANAMGNDTDILGYL